MSTQQISFANRKSTKSDDLEFIVGDAESLSLGRAFDIITMIDSLVCISNLDQLLKSVQTVMHPCSYLVIADLFKCDDVNGFESTISALFEICAREDASYNVT